MEQMKDFVIKYFKIIVATLTFVLALYVQHVNNTAQIAALEIKCAGLELTIKEQYDRINAMKLDKSVFEATMRQFNTLQSDLHEIRADIRELLKCQLQHKKKYLMIKNTYVTIVASDELTKMSLDGLIGHKGLVVEDLSFMGSDSRGGMVLLEEKYLDEFIWFIPETAVIYE